MQGLVGGASASMRPAQAVALLLLQTEDLASDPPFLCSSLCLPAPILEQMLQLITLRKEAMRAEDDGEEAQLDYSVKVAMVEVSGDRLTGYDCGHTMYVYTHRMS